MGASRKPFLARAPSLAGFMGCAGIR